MKNRRGGNPRGRAANSVTEVETNADLDTALADLLRAVPEDPIELVERLRTARERATEDTGLQVELLAVERRFLAHQAARPGASAALRDAFEVANDRALEHAEQQLRSAPDTDAAVLFDLAELRATLRVAGAAARAAALGDEIRRRVDALPRDASIIDEVRERYAAVATDEEDLQLPHRIALLEETADVLLAIGDRIERRSVRALGTRLRRQACDRVLAQRLERWLTARGARLLEITSLLLLLLLMVLLLVETVFELSPATLRLFLRIDIAVCAFFVAEFFFKLALAPARLSWFLRNALTDLLPALPAALLFLNVPHMPAPSDTIWVRLLRLMRVAYFARYINALRPALRLLRVGLLMVRGLDFLVARFSWLLNRDFVFFERDAEVGAEPSVGRSRRSLLFRALRREHVLLAEVPRGERGAVLVQRAERLHDAYAATAADDGPEPGAVESLRVRGARPDGRDVPVERVLDLLNDLRPDELSHWLARRDIDALDRVAKVINSSVVRRLPFLRKLRSGRPGTTPEDRVVQLGRRVAHRLATWRERALFVADLHGILTGPQILDRVATAMVNASKRPAVRLLLFGGLFVAVRLVVGEDTMAGRFLERFVATPLIVLGAICLVLLTLGRWLKRLAGEASETLTRTAEAHFIGLLDLLKRRDEDVDVAFLARRVFRWEMPSEEAQWALASQVMAIRRGRLGPVSALPANVRQDAYRVALLYVHYLDGGILHQSDVSTAQQLLANLSLQNIRNEHLRHGKRAIRRLRRLALEDGPVLGGPFLWFRCITESLALESAKRVIDYNQHCVTKVQRAKRPPEVGARMDLWVAKRRAQLSGRILEKVEVPGHGEGYTTTEFNALDFTSVDAERDAYLAAEFGDEVRDLLIADRQRMVREIFGTKPLDRLPREQRTINFYRFYQRRLSSGRILLLPFYWLWAVCKLLRLGVLKTVEIVREIMVPASVRATRLSGRAPFAVALRKIHRMRAPGLLEAMRTRVEFDPAYCGAPIGWTGDGVLEEHAELDRDIAFLRLDAAERQQLLARAERMRRLVEAGHVRLRALPLLDDQDDPLARRLGERAVTIAYVTDRQQLRTLLTAEEWFENRLAVFESRGVSALTIFLEGLRARIAFWRQSVVARWLAARHADRRLSRRARAGFERDYRRRGSRARRTIDAWDALPPGQSPGESAGTVAREVFANHGEVSRELAALRTVQSVSVLDVRNYKKLVFDLGGFAADGEDAAVAEELP